MPTLGATPTPKRARGDVPWWGVLIAAAAFAVVGFLRLAQSGALIRMLFGTCKSMALGG